MVQQTVSKPVVQSDGEIFHSQFISSYRPSIFLRPPRQPENPKRVPIKTDVTSTSVDDVQTQVDSALPEPSKAKLKTCRATIAQGVNISGDGYLRLNEVLNVYPVSRATWYQGIERGVYPKQINLGKRSVAWTRESIRQLIANPPKF